MLALGTGCGCSTSGSKQTHLVAADSSVATEQGILPGVAVASAGAANQREPGGEVVDSGALSPGLGVVDAPLEEPSAADKRAAGSSLDGTGSSIAGEAPGSVAFADAARTLGIEGPAAASAPLRVGSSETYAKLFMTRAKLHLVLVEVRETGVLPLRSIDVFAMDPTYGEGFAASRAEEPEELDAEGRPLPRRYLAGRIRSIKDLDGDGHMESTIQIRVSRMCCAIGEIKTMQRVIVDLETGKKQADLLLTTEAVSYVIKGTMALRDRDGDGRDDLVYAEVFRDRIEGTSKRSTKVAIYDSEVDRYVGDVPTWEPTDCCPQFD